MQTKKFLKASVLVLLMSACGNSKEVAAPQAGAVNLSDQLMMSTLWMQRSYEVRILQTQHYKTAETLLEQNLKKLKREKKPAVILDIDETVLDNSPYEARMILNGAGFDSETWGQWVNEKQASLVPGALGFLRKAESLGVEVFYISNRDQAQMEPTIENLRLHNLPGSDESHVLLKAENSDKTERREWIKAEFEVVLLVGDQLTDFIEEIERFRGEIPNSEGLVDSLQKRFVMLPNPMYGSFEQDLYRGERDLTSTQKDQFRREALITKMKK